jgi:hypothetical protein
MIGSGKSAPFYLLTEKWKILGNLTLPNSSKEIIKNSSQSLIGTDVAVYALNVNEKIYGLKCIVICQRFVSD